MGWGNLNQGQITVLLRLLGAGPYNTQLRTAAASTLGLARATSAAGLAAQTAGKRTFLMNQALYTMRRYAFYGTIAVVSLGAALVKLGYNYLATRDSARAALKPIFSDSQALTTELNKLFTLSKYSPFVLKDMTDALRVMYPALHGAGMGVQSMNSLLLSMTNILSQSGKTTPAALSRISYAIQHMIFQGRLTGILIRQLASAGVDTVALRRSLGIIGTSVTNISRLNISPNSVINALIALGQSGIYKNAALRISMQSFPGMLQVMKDSLSQFMGIFLGGAYASFRSKLYDLIKPGGLMDQLSKAGSGRQAILMLSSSVTGNSGLGKGFLLLLNILKNLGLVFTNVVVPAFIIALHSLIVFYPILELINFTLQILAKHAWLVKFALVPLAAWFIITHTAMIGLWAGSKLLNIAMFGTATLLDLTATRLKIMYLWEFLTTGSTSALAAALGIANTQASALLLTLRALTLLGIVTITIELIIHRQNVQNWLNKKLGKTVGGTVGASLFMYNTLYQEAKKVPHKFATGVSNFSGGNAIVGEAGPELVNLPRGSNVIPLQHNGPVGNLSTMTGDDGKPILVQVILDRKVLAEGVARARQDKEARQ